MLIAEAASSVDRDKRTKEVIALRNKVESLSRNAQKTFRELAASLPADDRQEAQRIFTECAEAAGCEDLEELQRMLHHTERVTSMLTAAMLGAAGMTPAPAKISNPDSLIERF